MRAPFAACLMASVLFLLVLLHLALKPIKVEVSPLISFAPAKLHIQVRVHATEADRWVAVVVDSGEYYRRSDFSIEGDRTLYSWSIPDVPPGEYVILAAVGSGDTIRASDRLTATVQGM